MQRDRYEKPVRYDPSKFFDPDRISMAAYGYVLTATISGVVGSIAGSVDGGFRRLAGSFSQDENILTGLGLPYYDLELLVQDSWQVAIFGAVVGWYTEHLRKKVFPNSQISLKDRAKSALVGAGAAVYGSQLGYWAMYLDVF